MTSPKLRLMHRGMSWGKAKGEGGGGYVLASCNTCWGFEKGGQLAGSGSGKARGTGVGQSESTQGREEYKEQAE
jgi:hypothetical protein